MSNKFEYDEIIHELPDNGGAYVIFPWDKTHLFWRVALEDIESGRVWLLEDERYLVGTVTIKENDRWRQKVCT